MSATCVTAQFVKIQECVLDNGVLKQINVDYNRSNGEKSLLINGVRKSLDEVYPLESKQYIANQNFLINNEVINIGGAWYKKWASTRGLSIKEVVKKGEYKGFVYFVSSDDTSSSSIYLPLRRGCEFINYSIVKNPCFKSLVLTTDVKEPKIGDNITITVKTPDKGKIKYEWKADRVEINGKKDGRSIVVSTKKMTGPGYFSVQVWVSQEGKKCDQIDAFLEIYVKQ
jgi:hypothetical protein